MPNTDGNLIGIEAQLNWWLWTQFIGDANALLPDEPADFIPIGVATANVLPDAAIPGTVICTLVEGIGRYKLWHVDDWIAEGANPENGPDPLVYGGWTLWEFAASNPIWDTGIIDSWGGCGSPTIPYHWLPPRNLYALSVCPNWSKFMPSDNMDLCITVFQMPDGSSNADKWATAFSAAGMDMRQMELESQEQVDVTETQPRAMNYPLWNKGA